MAQTTSIELSDIDALALSSEIVDLDDYFQNWASERARVTREKIIAAEVPALLALGLPIPQTAEAIVQGAFDAGRVKTAVQREQERIAAGEAAAQAEPGDPPGE